MKKKNKNNLKIDADRGYDDLWLMNGFSIICKINHITILDKLINGETINAKDLFVEELEKRNEQNQKALTELLKTKL